MPDAISRAIATLNDVLERDPEALTRLVNLRVECNDRLAAHPTIRTADYGGVAKIGVLGLLNAALAARAGAVVGAKGRLNPRTGLFVRIDRFVDLRDGKVDEMV